MYMRVYFNPVMKSDTDIVLYAKRVAPFVSHPLFLSTQVNLTITKSYETSFNIYCFSSYCVPTPLLSLYRLFPCYESVYILYDSLVRVSVNTISDILSDMACSILQNISTYYILSIKYKFFGICYTDFQPLDPYHILCRTLLSFCVGIRACLQTKYKTFVRVDFFKCI